MDVTLYGKLIESLSANHEWGVLTEMLGKDTEFEAIYLVTCDDETAMWDGYLVFKDYRFSPSEDVDGIPYGVLQFKHFPPGAANGVLAAQRAEEYWKTLCGIFNETELRRAVKVIADIAAGEANGDFRLMRIASLCESALRGEFPPEND